MGGGGDEADEVKPSYRDHGRVSVVTSAPIPTSLLRRSGPGRINEDEGTFPGVDLDASSGSPNSPTSESSGVGSIVSANGGTGGRVPDQDSSQEWSPVWAPGSPLPHGEVPVLDTSATPTVLDEFEELLSSEVTVDVEAMRTATYRGVTDSVRERERDLVAVAIVAQHALFLLSRSVVLPASPLSPQRQLVKPFKYRHSHDVCARRALQRCGEKCGSICSGSALRQNVRTIIPPSPSPLHPPSPPCAPSRSRCSSFARVSRACYV
jgi:hypothetical protein